MTIRERRLQLDLTQEQLAELAGTRQEKISKWENHGGMSLQTVKVLAQIFNCTVDELIKSD